MSGFRLLQGLRFGGLGFKGLLGEKVFRVSEFRVRA